MFLLFTLKVSTLSFPTGSYDFCNLRCSTVVIDSCVGDRQLFIVNKYMSGSLLLEICEDTSWHCCNGLICTSIKFVTLVRSLNLKSSSICSLVSVRVH